MKHVIVSNIKSQQYKDILLINTHMNILTGSHFF